MPIGPVCGSGSWLACSVNRGGCATPHRPDLPGLIRCERPRFALLQGTPGIVALQNGAGVFMFLTELLFSSRPTRLTGSTQAPPR
jgi:hypothetical protein